MPLKIIEAPGDTEQRSITSAATSDWDATHARDGTSNVAVADLNRGARVTQVRKSGSNYINARGVLAYDFRNVIFPRGIRVVKADLFIGGTTVGAADTNGNKIRVGVITNPTNAGEVDIAATDYDLARYDAGSYTSAQAVANGINARAAFLRLDNSRLLRHLNNAINTKGVLHLGIRNELDFLDDASGVTGLNRAWFSPPSAQTTSLNPTGFVQLRLFYRVVSGKKFFGRGGGSRASKSGFQGSDISAGTSAGFS